MRTFFLPLGLILAIAVALLAPAPGTTLRDLGLAPWMVVIIFLINGYQTELRHFPKGGRFFFVLLLLGIVNLLVAPVLAVAANYALALAGAFSAGLILISAMPSTLSSAIVMTGLAKGNTLWALLFTVLLNLAAILSVPLVLSVALETSGAVSVDPLRLLGNLLLLVLLPFLIGQGARHLRGQALPGWAASYVPSSCIIATVWMSLSAAATTLASVTPPDLLRVAAGSLLVHGALLILCWGVASALRLERGGLIAFVFTGAQKTLPVALSVLAVLPGLELALIPCLVFHFLQLFLDSFLAARLGRSAQTTSP